MGDDYMETQDSAMSEIQQNRTSEISENADPSKDYGGDMMGFDDGGYDDEEGNNFRGNRGRGNFRLVHIYFKYQAVRWNQPRHVNSR